MDLPEAGFVANSLAEVGGALGDQAGMTIG